MYAFYYRRRRAQILAARSKELGGIVSFVTFGGQPINLVRNGNIVAAFTVDDIVVDRCAAPHIHRRHRGNTADENQALSRCLRRPAR